MKKFLPVETIIVLDYIHYNVKLTKNKKT